MIGRASSSGAVGRRARLERGELCCCPNLGGASLLVLGSFANLGASGELPAPQAPSSPIERAELEAHLRFLAGDALGGRDTGSEGSWAAALYLARELANAGFAPGVAPDARFDGDPTGGYLQDALLFEERYLALPNVVARGPEGSVELVWGEDYDIVRAQPLRASLRIARASSGAALPAPAGDQALLLPGSKREREALLDAAGTPGARGHALLLSMGSAQAGKARDELPRARFARLDPASEGLPAELRLRGPRAAEFEAGRFEALELELEWSRTRARAVNVVAVLPGVGLAERPELGRECVVLSAHYDHLGTKSAVSGAPADEDLIFNGADDDASGTSVVLEIAEALALGPKPARSVVVLLATAEEIGLLGTLRYLDAPSVPLDQTAANLNFEMLGRPDAKLAFEGEARGRVWFTGFERSNLGAAFAAAGLAVQPDPYPAEHFFERSDNYAFARLGIVAQTFSSYDLHQDYHTVRDDVSSIDFEHLTACARALLEATRLVVRADLAPEWLPGGNPRKQ